MNPYTIVKVLGLCLGAVSVVTLSLPEQRSEINARAAGGYGFNNNPTKHSSADAEIELSVSNATTGEHFDALPLAAHHVTFIPDQLDQRLEGMDHVDFSKHDPRTLGATNGVAIDVRRDTCLRIHCATGEIPAPNPHDCKKLGERLSQKDSAMFDVQPSTSRFPSRFRRIITPE